jgi:hypothetical protein
VKEVSDDELHVTCKFYVSGEAAGVELVCNGCCEGRALAGMRVRVLPTARLDQEQFLLEDCG